MSSANKLEKTTLRFLSQLLKDAGVELGYLFGSTARGDSTPESDIDIAILLPRTTTAHARFKIRLSLISAFSELHSKKIDLIVLNDVPSLLFKYVIISEGQLLYRRDETTQALFESRVLAQYFDFRPCIDQFNAAYVAKNS